MIENDRHVPVQALLGGRWVAGEALAVRRNTEGSTNKQILLEHHGHLEWIDAALVRRVLAR